LSRYAETSTTRIVPFLPAIAVSAAANPVDHGNAVNHRYGDFSIRPTSCSHLL
jgi:hypothetical protein